MPEPSFAKSLLACDDASSLKLKGGNRFIRKLPNDRSLSYLHKLHTPLDDERLGKLFEALDRLVSAEFDNFLRWSNGASLFDNNLLLFGFVEKISRDLSTDTQQPISIVTENIALRTENHARWDDGWLKVGSVVGENSNGSIELNASGACVLRSGNDTFSSGSFEQCIGAIIDRIGICFSCDGIIDGRYAELDAAVASLFHPQ